MTWVLPFQLPHNGLHGDNCKPRTLNNHVSVDGELVWKITNMGHSNCPVGVEITWVQHRNNQTLFALLANLDNTI